MNCRLAQTVLALTLTASLAGAETRCYEGGSATGVLTFTGVIEDEEFSGRFGDFLVEYCIGGESPDTHAIEVRVRLASADTDNRDRDEALVGPEFFAVGRHPESVWRSGTIVRQGDDYLANGELSLKGITAPQSIRYTLSSEPAGFVAVGGFMLEGDTDMERLRFDIGTGEFADTEFIRNEVIVRFRVELRESAASK